MLHSKTTQAGRKSRKPEITVEPMGYTVDETCTALRIGRTKFYEEVAAGELETYTIGDRRFTTAEQRLRYLDRKVRRDLEGAA
jgi:hypothetical protein